MEEKELLQKIGLTDSESKVYLALLKLGKFSQKGEILKHAKIAPSKIYHILDKLIDKGLASTIIKNNVKHFAPASPSRIKDYLATKHDEILEEQKTAEELLPKLEGLYESVKEKTTAEIFMGWKGMETAYTTVLTGLKKGETVFVLGASEGTYPEKTKRFYKKYSVKMKLRGLKSKIIFNEGSRDYVARAEKEANIKYNKRFLFENTTVEMFMANDVVAIVMLKEEPIIILIKDKDTTKSFITYFDALWKIAKK